MDYKVDESYGISEEIKEYFREDLATLLDFVGVDADNANIDLYEYVSKTVEKLIKNIVFDVDMMCKYCEKE